MDARLKDLPFEPGNLNGLSEKSIRCHHQNSYCGAVKRLNALPATLRITICIGGRRPVAATRARLRRCVAAPLPKWQAHE